MKQKTAEKWDQEWWGFISKSWLFSIVLPQDFYSLFLNKTVQKEFTTYAVEL